MMYIYLFAFFQDTDATVKDSFSPLGPSLLPWENRLGRGQQTTRKRADIATTRPNLPSALWGRNGSSGSNIFFLLK